MKGTNLSKIGMFVTAIVLCVALRAQDEGSNWYFRADLGASVAMATDVEEFLGPVGDVEVEFDPGVRLGAVGGYRLTPWLAVELESGVLFNSVDEVDGDNLDMALSQVPLMANLLVECNHFDRWVPFAGVGAGGVTSLLEIDESFNVPGGTLFLEGSESDLVFAYHAFAGFRYEFNDRMGIGLIYRFMGTDGPTWEVDTDAFGGDLEIGLDGVFTHSLSVLFRMGF